MDYLFFFFFYDEENQTTDESNESVTNCNAFKLKATDGKMRLTDVADMQGILRTIQSIPSPKAESFKGRNQNGKEKGNIRS